MTAPRLSVIIVNWNSHAVLERCLQSLDRDAERLDLECVIIDNASATGDLPAIVRDRPYVRLVRNATNAGFAAAVNQGVRRTSGPYVLLLNPDAFVGEGALAHLLSYLDANADVGVAGPAIRDPGGAIQGSARAFPTPLSALFGRNGVLTRWLPDNRITAREVPVLRYASKEPMAIDWVSGACLLARRRALENVGLLDERFFVYWEDADLCRRISDAGWRIMYVPTAEVEHIVGASSSAAPVRSTLIFHVSAYRLFRKYFVRQWWHPLSIAAASALAARAGLLVAVRWSARMMRRGSGGAADDRGTRSW